MRPIALIQQPLGIGPRDVLAHEFLNGAIPNPDAPELLV
ncbi:hypothetical protein SC1_00706 [Sphingopyxis sp. C-1]|nr:hypothetical protein SC1_00706 [Sphingopyxis sp. C-1]